MVAPSLDWAEGTDISQAIELARGGHAEEALVLLESAYARNPNNEQIFYDYLTVLSWAGHDERVAELAVRLPLQNGPAYVLEAAAKSARRRGDYVQAEMFYQSGVKHFPANLEFPAGILLTLADAGRSQDARELAVRFEQQYPAQLPILRAEEYVFEKDKDYFSALQACQRMLLIDPADRSALVRQILVLDWLGAPNLAIELASRDPRLLTVDEWQRLRGDQAAISIRWGDLPTLDEKDRFLQTDKSLCLLEKNIDWAKTTQADTSAFTLRTRFDELVALRNRFQMNAVIEEYDRLIQENAKIPDYALSAVADAFLYRQQPGEAKKLYEKILAHQANDFETQLSLFYALIELEDFSAAYNLIDQLEQGQPTWLEVNEDGRILYLPNHRKLRAASSAAMARLYGDQYDQAEARLRPLRDQAPANLDLISALGEVYAARGWPRLSQKTLELGLSVEPQYKALQLGFAQACLTRREYGLAGELIDRLYAAFPEDLHVRSLHRDWEIHNLRELRLSAGYGDSTGFVVGNKEKLLQGILFSQPIAEHYRAFLSSRYAFASFPEGDEIYRRQGAGVEYRGPDLESTVELTYNEDGAPQTGGMLSLLWEIDDHWALPINVQIFSLDTPLRALKQDVTANSADLGLIYRESELSRISLNAQLMDFSDGNFRRNFSASFEQRLVTLPTYKLTGILDLSASANSDSKTVYFNPGHDFTASLTLDNLQRLYRWYDKVFSHRLSLTIGNYWQKDYADDYLAGLAYEHIWEFAYRFELIYGFSRFRKVYDGQSEYQNNLYGRINWRF